MGSKFSGELNIIILIEKKKKHGLKKNYKSNFIN